jgi:hypothetical protein
MTNGTDNNADFAVLYDNQGNNGETVLRYSSQPTVQVLQGVVSTAWDATKGDLRLSYVHNGLARVLIQSGSGSLLLFLADTATAEQFWPLQVQGRPIVGHGPYLIRAAKTAGDALLLAGDTSGPTQVSVLFPQSVRPVWHGSLSGAPRVKLPSLTNWSFQFESPERNPVFDDSSWTPANHTTTNNPNPPGSLPILYEDDYGFGAYAGGIPVSPVPAPGWNGSWGTPGLQNNVAVSLSTNLSVITGGQTAKISGTVVNAGDVSAQSVKVALNVPANWTVSPSSPVQIPVIPPGKSVSVSWNVQIPSGLTPGQYQLAALANYTESGTTNSTAGTVALRVPYANLAAAFDNVGVTSNSNTNPSPGFLGFDGIGTTYSAEGLTTAGLAPGATVSVGRVTLTWPDVQPAQPNNVLANGQAFLISGESNQLGFLLASNNAPLSGTGTVYYTDGSSTTFDLAAGNFWYQSGQNGNPTQNQGAAVNYANYPTGSSGHTVYVFGVTVPINASKKTVQAVVLPKVNGSVAGYQAAMHIFALGL